MLSGWLLEINETLVLNQGTKLKNVHSVAASCIAALIIDLCPGDGMMDHCPEGVAWTACTQQGIKASLVLGAKSQKEL